MRSCIPELLLVKPIMEMAINIVNVVKQNNDYSISASFLSSESEDKFWSVFLANMRSLDKTSEVKEWPRLPCRGQYTESARQRRLSFIREHTGVTMEHIGKTDLQPESQLASWSYPPRACQRQRARQRQHLIYPRPRFHSKR